MCSSDGRHPIIAEAIALSYVSVTSNIYFFTSKVPAETFTISGWRYFMQSKKGIVFALAVAAAVLATFASLASAHGYSQYGSYAATHYQNGGYSYSYGPTQNADVVCAGSYAPRYSIYQRPSTHVSTGYRTTWTIVRPYTSYCHSCR
jgi:hypothetical protein